MNVERELKRLEQSKKASKVGDKWTAEEVKTIQQLKKVAARIGQVAISV